MKRSTVPCQTGAKKRCRKEKIAMMQVLLLSDVDPSKMADLVISCRDSTELHEASTREEALMLLYNGANVNERNGWGETPLHRAVSEGKGYDFVNLLLAYGAEVNACCGFGRRPLHCAMKPGGSADKDVIDLLINYGAELDESDFNRFTYFSNRVSRMPVNSEKWFDRGDIVLLKTVLKTTLLYGYSKIYCETIDNIFCKQQSHCYEIGLFTKACIIELLWLRSETISENFTWFDMVTSEPEELKLLPVTLQGYFATKYKLYYDIIVDSYVRYRRRVVLFNVILSTKMVVVSEISNREISVNCHCLSTICENLVNNDIGNLLKAIYDEQTLQEISQIQQQLLFNTR